MDVTERLPSAEEVLRLLGLRQQSRGSDLLSELLIFGAGVLVGAGIATLLTPVPGSEVRGEISRLLEEVRGKPSAERTGDGQQRGDS
jgi:hypothetical protein